MGPGEILAIALAVVMAIGAVAGFRDAVKQERRIMSHLGSHSATRLRQHADQMARDLLDEAVEEADPEAIERVKRAGFVWRTNGHDGGGSGGEVDRPALAAIVVALLAAPWVRRLLLVVLLTAVILLVAGPQMVGFAAQEARGDPPHVVIQTEIPTAQLMYSMRGMAEKAKEDGLSLDELKQRIDSLLLSHRAPDPAAIIDLRRRIIEGDDS